MPRHSATPDFFRPPERVDESQYLVIKSVEAGTWTSLPDDVSDQFMDLLLLPYQKPLHPSKVFTDIVKIKRGDGAVTYGARVPKERAVAGDLALENEVAFFVDYDEDKKFGGSGVLGRVVVERPEASNPRVLSFANIDSLKTQHLHLSYPRLWAIQNYCMRVFKAPLSSGVPTETKDVIGRPKPEDVYEGGHHIWQWFVDRNLADGPLPDDANRFVFHPVPASTP